LTAVYKLVFNFNYQLSKHATSKIISKAAVPIAHPGGAATALLALILCAYLMSSSDDILPMLA